MFQNVVFEGTKNDVQCPSYVYYNIQLSTTFGLRLMFSVFSN
jgi:hypothetical protein